MIRPLAIVLIVLAIGTMALGAALDAGGQPGPTGTAASTATPSPSPSPATGRDRVIESALGAVEHAFNAGDVRPLCRPGALVDPAVIRQQAASGGCESELETLVADGRMQLTVERVNADTDLATLTVRTAHGTVVPVDLVRSGTRWLLSFSDGDDPMSALTS